ncbi:hypothetical protein N500_0479 [Wolbachia pipientis wUni]|nr:hypothetical protein N500_0479 [Wolbachia pipientis wUni]
MLYWLFILDSEFINSTVELSYLESFSPTFISKKLERLAKTNKPSIK